MIFVGKNYLYILGQVTDIKNDNFEVMAMDNRGMNFFNWPNHEDKVFYPRTAVRAVIEPPIFGRRHFSLTRRDWETYLELIII